MTFTHEEMLEAVRKAGRDGQAFSCAAVRDQLNVSTRNRRELSKFHRRFKTFQDAAPDEIEKIGNNTYRLKKLTAAEPEQEADVASAQPVELEVIASVEAAAPELEADETSAELEVTASIATVEAAQVDEVATVASQAVDAEAIATVTASEPADEIVEVAADEPVEEIVAVAPDEPAGEIALAAVAEAETAPEPVLAHETEVTEAPETLKGAVAPEVITAQPAAAEPDPAGLAEAPLSAAAHEPEIAAAASVSDVHADDDDLGDSHERLVELDIYAIPDFDAPMPIAAAARSSEQPQQGPRNWLKKGQWLGRRVAELLGRA